MTAENPDVRAAIEAVAWYHELDFGGGLRARSTAPDVEQHRQTWRFIEAQLEAIAFEGRTVLDVGCWDGYWSFYAERRGAAHVLATDDISQSWASGEGIRLARDLLESRIDIRQDLSVYDLATLGRTFDVVMCLGVYYHLLDPFHAFAQIRRCCHADSIVVLEGNVGIGLPTGAAHYGYGRPREPAFTPSAGALETLLEAAYLRVVSQAWSGPHGVVRSRLARWRHGPSVSRRVFTVCAAFEGANPRHTYRPPFGLAELDPRFRGASGVTDRR